MRELPQSAKDYLAYCKERDEAERERKRKPWALDWKDIKISDELIRLIVGPAPPVGTEEHFRWQADMELAFAPRQEAAE